jgi:large repetitive protein
MKTKQQFLRWLMLLTLVLSALGSLAQVGGLTQTGNMTVCLNSNEPYGVIANAGSTYTWVIVAGSGGAGTITPGAAPNNLISINWTSIGTCTLQVTERNSSGCEVIINSIIITVAPLPLAPTITTPLAYCQNATAVPLTATGTGLLWYTSATGGTGSSTAPTPSTATVGNTSYWVSQTNASNCEGPRAEIVVTVNALPVPTITGTTPVCATTTGVDYKTETGMSNYVWTISAGGTITAGGTTDTVTVTWNTAGSQTISVNYQNANGCAAGTPTSKTITVDALPTASPIYHN